MVYTVVLEATAARIESSSLSLGTRYGRLAEMDYCTGLENRRSRKRAVSSNLTSSSSNISPWCNGSTAVSKTVSLGSSPRGDTKFKW